MGGRIVLLMELIAEEVDVDVGVKCKHDGLTLRVARPLILLLGTACLC